MLDLNYLFEIQDELTLTNVKTIEIFMTQKFGIDWDDDKLNKEICKFLYDTMECRIVDNGRYVKYEWLDK